MKRAIPILIVLLAGLYFFNPTREDFKQFVEDRLEEKMQEEGIEGELGDLLSGGASKLAAGVVDKMTERKDFLLFSIYEIPMSDEEYKYLGIFKIFIPLQEKQPTELLEDF